MKIPSIRVEISFTSEIGGGRSNEVDLHSGKYRPRFRVDNGEHLGVALVNGSTDFAAPASCVTADAVLIYHPDVDYAALETGVLFEVLEGARVVGVGRVI
jgi:translation elongation factor EF-Tu-like GTPase